MKIGLNMKNLALKMKELGYCVIDGQITQVVQDGKPVDKTVMDSLTLQQIADSGKFNKLKRKTK